jgi:5'-3' exonuclease
MSKDHDFKRLLSYGDVFIRARSSDPVYDENSFFEEYGFHSHRYFDYLCLAGDASDNVQGVVPAKTAKSLVSSFPDGWNDLLAHLNPEFIARVTMNRAVMAWKLGPLTSERAIERDEEGLRAWYKGMEFKSMIKEPA